MKYITTIKNKKTAVEKMLHTIIADLPNQDALIKELAAYTVFPGGKRLRPLLTILMYEMLGGTKGNIYICASTTELLHAATIILDDLPCMDNTAQRHDKPCSHKKFGDANAILTAFALSAQSFRILSDKNNFIGIKENLLLPTIHEITDRLGFNGLIGGQIADLNAGSTLKKQKSDEQKINYTAQKKTCALFEICALIACCLSETDAVEKKQMLTYAHNVGLALQIFDDLHDTAEDIGLSFPKAYGVDETKTLLRKTVEKAQDCITRKNDAAQQLQQLPQLLLEKTI